jgi:hypothetical protein
MKLHPIFAAKLAAGRSLKIRKAWISLLSGRSLVVLGTICVCVLLTPQRLKAEGYPSRPIKLLVGAGWHYRYGCTRVLADELIKAMRK